MFRALAPLAALSCLATAIQPARALPTAPSTLPVFSTSVDVRKFGAKGDGVTDDTAAIQSAANAAISIAENWQVRVRHWNQTFGGIQDNPHPEIVFPAGTYKITRPVLFRRQTTLRGSGKAVILQADPTKDSFYFHGLLRSTVEDLQFQGGRIQLRFWTANNGTARVRVHNCVFSNSASYAIECRSYSKKLAPGEKWDRTKRWSPYELEEQGSTPKLTENPTAELQIYNNSTVADISRCRFENVTGAVDLSGDTSTVRDCDVTVSPTLTGSVFRLMGLVHLRDIRGVAQPKPENHQVWIETEGRYREISVRQCDFRSASGPGLCLIRSAAVHTNSSLIVQDSRIQSAVSRENALIWLAKDTQPSIVSLRGVQETSGKPVKALAWETVPSAASLKTTANQYRYALTFDRTSPNLDTQLPAVLEPIRLLPISALSEKETFVPELTWNYDTLESQATTIIDTGAKGVDQDPATDDTVTVQQLFDSLPKNSVPLVVLPSGIIKLASTIKLPSNAIIRSAGVTTFQLSDPTKDIFQFSTGGMLAFKNCDFSGGRNAIDIHPPTTPKTHLSFENCAFYDQEENGIQALAGTGQIGAPNQTELLVQGGIFATKRALTTNAAHSQISACWAISDPRLNDAAFFNNLGGTMRTQAILENPNLWQGDRGKAPEGVKNWTASKNTRWFDNFGQLYIQDNRFGGESGGMCNVFNRSSEGTVYIEGAITRFMNGATRQTILYLEKPPRRAVLRDISGSERSNATVIMNPDGTNARNSPTITLTGTSAE